MNHKNLKTAIQWVLPVLSACAILFFAMRPTSQAFVPFMRNTTPASWNLAALPNGQINWSVPSDAPAILRESILRTTEQWSHATDGVLKFGEGPGGIEFVWATDTTKIPDTTFLAYTTFSLNADFHITTAKITFNAANYAWHCGAPYGVSPSRNGLRETDLDAVLLHELGHALGLDHADGDPSRLIGATDYLNMPTMNSIVYAGAESLHTDDIVGIRHIYLHDDTVPVPELNISGSPAKGPRPLNVSFTQTLGDATTTWDFGDGRTWTGAAPSHKFTAPGTYTVTATVDGKTSTMTVEVEKKRAKPVRVKKVKAPKTAS